MELLIIFTLIVLNGILSMAEIAIVSVKRSRFKYLKEQGDMRAGLVLDLTENPNTFFSTVQVGITLIGILTGALGGAVLSDPLSFLLIDLGVSVPLANSVALGFVVVSITLLSLIIGELVPKRLGFAFSEKLALFMSGPMYTLSRVFQPVVSVLSAVTDGILDLLQIHPKRNASVSEEEVRMLLQEGTTIGIFEKAEKNIVEKVLNIGDAKISTLMQSRSKVIYLDSNASYKEIKDTVLKHQYSYFPVAEGSLDNIVGVLRTDTFLAETILNGENSSIQELWHKPLLIPENKKVLEALELFKRSRIHLGVIIDEYGSVQGIVTLTDILEAIVGDLPDMNEQKEEQIVRRGHGSWFVDGLVPTAEFKDYFHVQTLTQEEGEYNTIGGAVMSELGRVPVAGDKIELEDLTVEVADMDGNRVDQLIVSRHKKEVH